MNYLFKSRNLSKLSKIALTTGAIGIGTQLLQNNFTEVKFISEFDRSHFGLDMADPLPKGFVLAKSDEIGEGEVKLVRFGSQENSQEGIFLDRELYLTRVNGEIFCFSTYCPQTHKHLSDYPKSGRISSGIISDQRQQIESQNSLSDSLELDSGAEGQTGSTSSQEDSSKSESNNNYFRSQDPYVIYDRVFSPHTLVNYNLKTGHAQNSGSIELLPLYTTRERNGDIILDETCYFEKSRIGPLAKKTNTDFKKICLYDGQNLSNDNSSPESSSVLSCAYWLRQLGFTGNLTIVGSQVNEKLKNIDILNLSKKEHLSEKQKSEAKEFLLQQLQVETINDSVDFIDRNTKSLSLKNKESMIPYDEIFTNVPHKLKKPNLINLNLKGVAKCNHGLSLYSEKIQNQIRNLPDKSDVVIETNLDLERIEAVINLQKQFPGKKFVLVSRENLINLPQNIGKYLQQELEDNQIKVISNSKISYLNTSQNNSDTLGSIDITKIPGPTEFITPSFMKKPSKSIPETTNIKCNMVLFDEQIADTNLFSGEVELGFEEKLSDTLRNSVYWKEVDRRQSANVISNIRVGSTASGEYIGGPGSLFLDSYLGKTEVADQKNVQMMQGKIAAYNMMGFQKPFSCSKIGSLLNGQYIYFGDVQDYDNELAISTNSSQQEDSNLNLLFRENQIVGLYLNNNEGISSKKSEPIEQALLLSIAMQLNIAPSYQELTSSKHGDDVNFDFQNLENIVKHTLHRRHLRDIRLGWSEDQMLAFELR